MGILNRLYNIAKANTMSSVESLGKLVGPKGTRKVRDSTPGDTEFTSFSDGHAEDEKGRGQERQESTTDSAIPRQVIEDLAVFNLKPPSSMDEVRKARNREIKKYHSDKFIKDPERLNVSKEIMQIYNAAYDRLRAYYEKT
jgi:hypothetical protein